MLTIKNESPAYIIVRSYNIDDTVYLVPYAEYDLWAGSSVQVTAKGHRACKLQVEVQGVNRRVLESPGPIHTCFNPPSDLIVTSSYKLIHRVHLVPMSAAGGGA
jgi:hypothetical protein